MTKFLLTLYVSGDATSSRRARETLSRLSASHLPAGTRMDIVDVLTDPTRAEEAQVLATPTLIFHTNERPRRIIGDLSDMRKVLDFLGLDLTEEAR